LDEQGELALAAALEILKQKKATVIVITHRPGVLAVLDKLLLMKDGVAVSYGPRDEVMKNIAKKLEVQKGKDVKSKSITVPPII
jgi:ATP-binding cassette subfamily C exporter for protease/lipase